MSPLDELRMKREEMAGGFAMSMAMRVRYGEVCRFGEIKK
jgi:hypothetical protein